MRKLSGSSISERRCEKNYSIEIIKLFDLVPRLGFSFPVALLKSDLMKLKQSIPASLLLIVVLLCGVWSVRHQAVGIAAQSTHLRESTDLDTVILTTGFVATRSWNDSVKWWCGSWIAGDEVKFYQPLSSLAFYAQYRAFGMQGRHGFTIILLLLHLTLLVVLYLFLTDLFDKYIAVLATCLFTLNIA